MPDRLVLGVDFTTGDRGGLQSTREYAKGLDAVRASYGHLSADLRRVVAQMDVLQGKMRQGQALSTQETRTYDQGLKTLRQRVEVQRREIDMLDDGRRKARAGRQLAATEAAAQAFGPAQMGRGDAGVGQPGGIPIRGLVRAFFRGHRMQIDPETGEPREVEGGALLGGFTRARQMAGGAIQTGLGLAGLFEGLSMVSRAMGEFEERSLGVMRVGSMLGHRFSLIDQHVNKLRITLGYLPRETIAATEAFGQAAGFAGIEAGKTEEGVGGAAVLARAYGASLPGVSAALGTFARYTRLANFPAGEDVTVGASDTDPLADLNQTEKAAMRRKLGDRFRRADVVFQRMEANLKKMGGSGPRLYRETRAYQKAKSEWVASLSGAQAAGMYQQVKGGMAQKVGLEEGAFMLGGPTAMLARGFINIGPNAGIGETQGAMLQEYLHAAGGVAGALAAPGIIANPAIAAGMVSQVSSRMGLEPGEAGELTTRMLTGLRGTGDPAGYALKVMALQKSGLKSVTPRSGIPIGIKVTDPLDLDIAMEAGPNDPGVLSAYLAQGRALGPQLGRRGLRAMMDYKITAIQAQEALFGGKGGKGLSVEDFQEMVSKGPVGPYLADKIKSAMATTGGKLTETSALVSKDLEAMGKAMSALRMEVRSMIAAVAGGAQSGGLTGAVGAFLGAVKDHPGIFQLMALAGALRASSPEAALAWTAAAGAGELLQSKPPPKPKPK